MVAPVAGLLSDKANPKIPAIIGILLLSFSLYLNGSLSLFSERAQIMVSLYVRGFGMGLIFTPMSTIALSQIAKHKMAQASGLFNVIRQVGGSFGVAILGTVLTRRVIFHSAMYGQAVDQYSPAFQHISYSLRHFVQQTAGGSTAEAALRANALLASHVGQQAFVQAINDNFMIAAVVTLFCVVPILFLRTRKPEGYRR
jgi:DHA2 family multidrug resistance protein